MRLAVLVPAPDYAAEWHWAYEPQAQPLVSAGATVDPLPWTDAHSLTGYDLILPLVAWGYHERYEEWLALLDGLQRQQSPVANPVKLLRWNSDKSYLAELAAKGVATVPSIAVPHLDERSLLEAREQLASTEVVVKPQVSASAYGTHRLRAGDGLPEQVRGWRMLVQPWLTDIVETGEYSLIFFGGAFSHAVAKVPRQGEFRVQPEYGGIISRCDPPAGSLALAQAALDAAPAETVYARVDMVIGNDGGLQIIELELIEPALFLAQAPDAVPRFVAAVLSAAKSARE